jgi:hypothetical protein
MKYTVLCDDNFHYMDEGERSAHGQYDSAEAAIAAAKAIVDRSLLFIYRPGMTADVLYDHYTDFGDDPFIRSDDPTCVFSAWTYAQERCPEICRAASAGGAADSCSP